VQLCVPSKCHFSQHSPQTHRRYLHSHSKTSQYKFVSFQSQIRTSYFLNFLVTVWRYKMGHIYQLCRLLHGNTIILQGHKWDVFPNIYINRWVSLCFGYITLTDTQTESDTSLTQSVGTELPWTAKQHWQSGSWRLSKDYLDVSEVAHGFWNYYTAMRSK